MRGILLLFADEREGKEMTEMRKQKAVIYIVILLVSVLVLSALPVSGEADIYQDVIRLHILADSDSAEAQSMKIKVRDAILTTYGEALKTKTSREEAEAALRPLLGEIEKTAEAVLSEEGCTDSVEVTLIEEFYETRVYRSFRMPAGNYLSLSVKIGEAKGQNFFCVLFPALCTDAALAAPEAGDIPVGLTPAEYELITGGSESYRVKFKFLEVISTLFS